MTSAIVPLPFLERIAQTADPQSAPVVILLHGRAAKADTIFSINGLLDPNFHIIAIQAPYECPRGEYEWFLPYDYEHPLDTFSESHFAEAETILTRQIQTMMHERGITNDRLIIGGFSQGAAMSHILAMRGMLQPRAIMAMSGFFPRILLTWPMPKQMPTYFISHGSNDEVLPLSESKFAYDFCISHGLDATFYEYKGRHKMSIQMLRTINTWVNGLLHRS